MTAAFNTPIPCNCTCGEHRQFVCRYFTHNGTALTQNLCSNTLDPSTWHEDWTTSGGKNLKYGYHSIAFGTIDCSDLDQATGCTYTGFDFPGFRTASLASGDMLEINLDFQGKLVDACDSDRVLRSSAWSVAGSGTVP